MSTVKKPRPKPKKADVKPEMKVLYDTVSVLTCIGDKAITAEQAKHLLGWEEEGKVEFKTEFLLHDSYEKKIRCNNNIKNRPLTKSNVELLKQEILRGRWRFNGEPIIIGKHGRLLNGQHSLIALILANQLWLDDKESFAHVWPNPPTIEKLVVRGVDESDETVNTMDTAKPRSLAEVIARSEYFADLKQSIRVRISRTCDHAVRWLWTRTGAGEGTLRRTHAESLAFLNKHPRLLECVRFMYETNDGGKNLIKRYLSVGYASAMLYLMGCSTTESDRGENSGYIYNSCEAEVEWDRWDKAQTFWTLLADSHQKVQAVLPAMAALVDVGKANDPFCLTTVIVKAWNLWINDKKIEQEDIECEIVEDDDGVYQLSELPNVGGIDIGKH